MSPQRVVKLHHLCPVGMTRAATIEHAAEVPHLPCGNTCPASPPNKALTNQPGTVYIHTMKGAVAPEAVEEMTGCVCFALRKAARAVTQFYDRALKSHRLRVTQLSILVGASQFGAVPLAKLAQVLGMDRTTLLRNVRPLVRRRLLEVSQAADSQRTEIRATAGGRALLGRVYPEWKRAQDRALKSLQGSDWARSLEALGEGLRSAK